MTYDLDLEVLVTKMPPIFEGGRKWVRKFEEETSGQLLAVGDLKSIWARTMGIPAMSKMFSGEGLGWMMGSDADGTEFNPYRARMWDALKKEYPTKIDPRALKGDAISEKENPLTYIETQINKWRQETAEDIENNPLLSVLFRTAIIDAMPAPVKSRLEDVVGLTEKSHKEFTEHVRHAVEKHRKEEKKVKDQEKDIQRKLTQLQLTELTNKNKKMVQAPVMNNMSKPETVPMMQTTAPNAPQTQPVFNVYTQQQRPQPQQKTQMMRRPTPLSRRGGRMGQPGGRGAGGACWGCGQLGHIRQNCQASPWPTPDWVGRGSGDQQPRNRQMNPAQAWAGPNYGY